QEIAGEIINRWPGEQLSDNEAESLWSDLREFRWAYSDGPLFKIALTPSSLVPLHQGLAALSGSKMHASAGGNLAVISLPAAEQMPALEERLRSLGLCALTLRGKVRLWCGIKPAHKIEQAVKTVLDPNRKFPALAD